MNHVLKLNDAQLEALLDFYADSRKNVPNPYMKAFIKQSGLTISIYTSNKVVFQGEGAEEAFFFWHEALGLPELETEAEAFDTPSIGSDESGAGDYFGPLCVGAVHIGKADMKHIDKLGLKDSKALTDETVRTLAPKIRKAFTNVVYTLDNERYNRHIEEGRNANKLKALLHEKAHRSLLQKVEGRPLIIVDQFCDEVRYDAYLKQLSNPVRPDRFRFRAESAYASVAAASILARHAFLHHLEELSNQAGTPLPKGASSEVERVAANILRTQGEDALRRLAKVHFRTTEKAKKR